MVDSIIKAAISMEGERHVVRVQIGDEAQGPVDFDFDASAGSTNWVYLQSIESGSCTEDQLKLVGTRLWAALFPEQIREWLAEHLRRWREMRALVHIYLQIPEALESLPWDALYERKIGFLAADARYSTTRLLPPDLDVAAGVTEPLARPLGRVLVVIPEGSGLKSHAEHDAIVGVLSERDPPLDVGLLTGTVTLEKLREGIDEGAWDIVHFIGHGQIDAHGRVVIRMNGASAKSEMWVDAERFASAFSGGSVTLAVMNCCLGAAPERRDLVSGLGPLLMRAGIQAVVAMRYEIADRLAVSFARRFYRDLLRTGSVAVAVDRARLTLHDEQGEDARAFITPVLTLTEGADPIFAPQIAAAEPTPSQAPRRASAPLLNLPRDLEEAFREGRCVPVIGPGLFGAPGVGSPLRRSSPGEEPGPLGPRRLAKHLTGQLDRSDADEIEGLDASWLDDLLLQRACTYFVRKHKRFKLVQEVKTVYRAFEASPPDELLALAGWKVPGMFYTGIDGLMQAACDRRDVRVRVVNRVDDRAGAGASDIPLLVHLRGSPRQPESLVLTVEEHDRLVYRILQRLSEDVEGLIARTEGCALLFLGVSPQDACLKHLISRVVTDAVRDNLAGAYFVCPNRSQVDESCWERLSMSWISEPHGALIEALSALLPGKGGR